MAYLYTCKICGTKTQMYNYGDKPCSGCGRTIVCVGEWAGGEYVDDYNVKLRAADWALLRERTGQKRTCKSCKHWKGPQHYKFVKVAVSVEGRCLHPELSYAEDDVTASGATDGANGGIFTGPDFGCTHYQEEAGSDGRAGDV